jgi:hypothetical protein
MPTRQRERRSERSAAINRLEREDENLNVQAMGL